MSLTEKQIENIMQKNVASKTILVAVKEIDKVISNHAKEGWSLVKKTEFNGRFKLTFQKLK